MGKLEASIIKQPSRDRYKYRHNIRNWHLTSFRLFMLIIFILALNKSQIILKAPPPLILMARKMRDFYEQDSFPTVLAVLCSLIASLHQLHVMYEARDGKCMCKFSLNNLPSLCHSSRECTTAMVHENYKRRA